MRYVKSVYRLHFSYCTKKDITARSFRNKYIYTWMVLKETPKFLQFFYHDIFKFHWFTKKENKLKGLAKGHTMHFIYSKVRMQQLILSGCSCFIYKIMKTSNAVCWFTSFTLIFRQNTESSCQDAHFKCLFSKNFIGNLELKLKMWEYWILYSCIRSAELHCYFSLSHTFCVDSRFKNSYFGE